MNIISVMICDDCEDELKKIRRMVLRYADEHPDISLEVRGFLNSLDMTEEISKCGAPDIALLDICMPGVTGTQIAREIQSKSGDCTDIIFLTASSEFAVEAFSLHAQDYLTKPFSEKRLADTLGRVIEKRQRRFYVHVFCGKEIHRVDLYQVLYAEAKNHGTEIFLKSGGCLKTRSALSELNKQFGDLRGFISVGASYIVNLRYVHSLRESFLQMSNGDNVPVPRRLRNDIKRQYLDFYTREASER